MSRSHSQLIDDIAAAGGSLRVRRKRWGDSNTVDYEHRARLAESYGKVPAGSRLVITRVSAEELLIELRDDEVASVVGPDNGAQGAPITVPSRLTNYHPVASDFRNQTNLHEVSRKALPRVLRIVHALATEAERRGYEIGCVKVNENRGGHRDWSPAREGQLVVTINGHPLRVALAREHANQVQQLPKLPADPKLSAEALKPYLGRWSP